MMVNVSLFRVRIRTCRYAAWRVKGAHIDGLHSGAACGFYSRIGIFVNEAIRWCNAQPTGRFEEHVGLWFMTVSYTHLTLPTIYSV